MRVPALAKASRFVIVRLLLDQELPRLEIQLTLAERQRNLLRNPSEPVERGLQRLAAAALPKTPRGNKGSVSASEGGSTGPAQLLGESGEPLDVQLTAASAWQAAHTLCVGSSRFRVLYDPVEISELEMSFTPVVGVPLMPRIESRGSGGVGGTVGRSVGGAGGIELRWERSKPFESGGGKGSGGGPQWETLSLTGAQRAYTPSEAELGCRLRVTAVPPGSANVAGATEALSRQVESEGVVELAPPRPVLARRLSALAEAREGALEGLCPAERVKAAPFRVCCYNMLADTYKRNWGQPGGIDSYCAPELTAAKLRLPRLLAEVREVDAELVCLEEVDVFWWTRYWEPQLSSAGYTAVLTPKQGVSSSEGIVLAVRDSAFELIGSRQVDLSGAALSEEAGLRELLGRREHTAAAMRRLPTVGQIATLRETAGARRHLIVAHTHLYFAAPAVHVRLLQTAALLAAAEREREALRAAGEGDAPLILAGDLNSDNTDGAVHLLMRGVTSAAHRDWLRGELMWRGSLGLEPPLAASHERLVSGRNGESGAPCHESASPKAAEGSPTQGEFDEARMLARRFHRLRYAMRRLVQQQQARRSQQATASVAECGAEVDTESSTESSTPQVNGDALLEAAARDAKKGLSLLESAALAAVELSEQAQMPLTMTQNEGGIADGMKRLERLGDELEATLARLQQGADEADKEQSGGLGAGVRLAHGLSLSSAYGDNAHPTHALRNYENGLDWIFYEVRTERGVCMEWGLEYAFREQLLLRSPLMAC